MHFDHSPRTDVARHRRQYVGHRSVIVVVPKSAHGPGRGSGHGSYGEAYRAFRPLLTRWGRLQEILHPESQLDFAVLQARQRSGNPISLCLAPFSAFYPTRLAPNVAYLNWEYPEIPHDYLCYSPRPNWVGMAAKLTTILVDNRFTAEALRRSGITSLVEIVPVPVSRTYFSVDAWNPERITTLECHAYLFPPCAQAGADLWSEGAAELASPRNLRSRLKAVYKKWVKPVLPKPMHNRLLAMVGGSPAQPCKVVEGVQSYLACARSTELSLSQVVYTAVLNPTDPDENWRDILSAYMYALRDRADAILVMVLNIPPSRRAEVLNRIYGYYLRQSRGPACKMAFVVGPLNIRQKRLLALGTTYFVSAARAKGICLRLTEFLAAGRPAIAPCHTGFIDCFGPDAGLVVDSHPEPSRIPGDPERRLVTTRHRIVWQSLCEHFRHSYELATHQSPDYQIMASRARRRARDRASVEAVWPRLAEALEAVRETTGQEKEEPPDQTASLCQGVGEHGS